MPEQSLTYNATGNPGVLELVSRQADELADDRVGLSATTGGTLALVKILAVELAAALRRIAELEAGDRG